jgi:hypothetical protein
MLRHVRRSFFAYVESYSLINRDRNPDERPSAAELRKHRYLELPPGWIFPGFPS